MGCECSADLDKLEHRRVLFALFAVNAVMFCVEATAGYLAQTAALTADSLDMLADAFVYALAFRAIGRAPMLKVRAAMTSGICLLVLALGTADGIIRRVIHGSDPQSATMMIIGAVALIANLSCLMLLSRHRDGEIHMRASWIFSTNDVLVNIGTIIAGLLVSALNSRLPDLLVGSVIVALVLHGGRRIVRDALEERTRILALNA